MTDDGLNERQRNCRNMFHYKPSSMICCPVCGMTRSQVEAHPPPAAPVRAVPSEPPPQAGGGHRVQIMHFEGTHPEAVVKEANDWLTKVSSDPRIQIAEKLSMFEYNGLLIIAVFYAVAY